MTLKTIPVRFRLQTPDGSPAAGAEVIARLVNAADGSPAFDTDAQSGATVPVRVVGSTDVDGSVVLALWPNARGTRGTAYSIRARVGAYDLLPGAVISVPDSAAGVEVAFESLLNVAPYPPIDAAQAAVAAAQGYAAAAAAAAAGIGNNLDGGAPDSIYGGLSIIDAGGV